MAIPTYLELMEAGYEGDKGPDNDGNPVEIDDYIEGLASRLGYLTEGAKVVMRLLIPEEDNGIVAWDFPVTITKVGHSLVPVPCRRVEYRFIFGDEPVPARAVLDLQHFILNESGEESMGYFLPAVVALDDQPINLYPVGLNEAIAEV